MVLFLHKTGRHSKILPFRTSFDLMKILFVDDTRDTRELFRMAFKIKGVDTDCAGDGIEAVEAVKENKYDAIIMDVEMPRMNGWEAVREIRLLQNGLTVPIIMFTAYGNGENKKKALDIGANDLWFKPLLPTEILERLNQYVA
jgi:DNA-binding response OmpR family regulator